MKLFYTFWTPIMAIASVGMAIFAISTFEVGGHSGAYGIASLCFAMSFVSSARELKRCQ